MLLVLCGIACLGISGVMLYQMMPREGKPPHPWMRDDLSESAMALGQFTLMIAGLSLIAKGVF